MKKLTSLQKLQLDTLVSQTIIPALSEDLGIEDYELKDLALCYLIHLLRQHKLV